MRWIGERPPWPLWRKFLRTSRFRPGRNTRLALLDHHALALIQKESGRFADQEIAPNGPREKKLLRHSLPGLLPHEVWQVSLKPGIAGRIRHGGISRAAGIMEIRSEIARLTRLARRRGITICEIELIHTHPSLELLILEPGRERFVFNGLSREDFRLGRALAPFLEAPLRLRALTPAASYSALFNNMHQGV